MRTKEPTFRVTKWLDRTIPLEAECTSCPDAQFKIGFSGKIRSPFYRPECRGFMEHLQAAFALHVAQVHTKPAVAKRAAEDDD